jgi:DUF3040 family protein
VVGGCDEPYDPHRARREGWSAPADERAKGLTMTTSSNPGPDDHDALSPRERQVLDGIEHDLTASDPHLARELRNRGRGSMSRWWPLSAPSTGVLVLCLLVLVLVGTLLPASAWAVLGIVTTLVVLPWLLLATTEKNGWD